MHIPNPMLKEAVGVTPARIGIVRVQWIEMGGSVNLNCPVMMQMLKTQRCLSRMVLKLALVVMLVMESVCLTHKADISVTAYTALPTSTGVELPGRLLMYISK